MGEEARSRWGLKGGGTEGGGQVTGRRGEETLGWWVERAPPARAAAPCWVVAVARVRASGERAQAGEVTITVNNAA